MIKLNFVGPNAKMAKLIWLKFSQKYLGQKLLMKNGAVVNWIKNSLGQLTARSLSRPEDLGSNLDIGNFFEHAFTVTCLQK